MLTAHLNGTGRTAMSGVSDHCSGLRGVAYEGSGRNKNGASTLSCARSAATRRDKRQWTDTFRDPLELSQTADIRYSTSALSTLARSRMPSPSLSTLA